MIGTQVIEEFVQSVALSHLVKGFKRCGALLMAAPESGKTTVASSAAATHVTPIAVMSGRSILRTLKDRPTTEFLLFNDLAAIRSMSAPATALLVTILNQLTQDERGLVGFAGKENEEITRGVGLIGCLPFKIFVDHRSRWKDMGFMSRLIPFSYQYGAELVAEIKDSIDEGIHGARVKPLRRMPKRIVKRPVLIRMNPRFVKEIRRIADARSATLGQIGIRLLQNYHSLVRAHALLMGRPEVTREDLTFLRAVDTFVSITACTPLNGNHTKESYGSTN